MWESHKQFQEESQLRVWRTSVLQFQRPVGDLNQPALLLNWQKDKQKTLKENKRSIIKKIIAEVIALFFPPSVLCQGSPTFMAWQPGKGRGEPACASSGLALTCAHVHPPATCASQAVLPAEKIGNQPSSEWCCSKFYNKIQFSKAPSVKLFSFCTLPQLHWERTENTLCLTQYKACHPGSLSKDSL